MSTLANKTKTRDADKKLTKIKLKPAVILYWNYYRGDIDRICLNQKVYLTRLFSLRAKLSLEGDTLTSIHGPPLKLSFPALPD